MDTVLAIIRRKLSGVPMSEGDDQHIHHQLKRSLGGVKRAVFALYGISFAFAVLGVTLAALVMTTQLRVRAIYAIAFVLFSFIGVIAAKAAHHARVETAPARKGAARNTDVTSKAAAATTPPKATPTAPAARSDVDDDSPPSSKASTTSA